MGQDGADLQLRCWGLTTQASVELRRGQLSEGIRVSREALALAEAIPDYAHQIAAGGALGQCYARKGKLEQALSALHRSQQVHSEHATGWGADRPLFNGLAEAYLLAAVHRASGDHGDWLSKAEGVCKEALRSGRRARFGLPEALILQGRCEWLRGRPKAAQRWWRRALALAEAQGQRYDAGVIHLEMGRRLGDRSHLDRAEAILAEIGAEWDLARAREALEEMA
jgi:tetratricopeptide (TPR) repeat protein